MNLFRWLVGVTMLGLGTANAMLAWNIETCTGNAADSLNAGILSIPLYVLGWISVPKNSRVHLIAVAAVPAVLNALVAFWTIELAMVWSACRVVTGSPFEPSGQEVWFLILWAVVGCVFWGGLAMSLKVAAWNKDEVVEHF